MASSRRDLAVHIFSGERRLSRSLPAATIFLGSRAVRPLLLAVLVPEVDLRLLELGLGLSRLAFRCSIIASQVVMLDDGEDLALLDLVVLLDPHLLDPAGDLGADHRLVLRLEIALGAEQLLGLAQRHLLDEADGHLGLGRGSARTACRPPCRRRRRAQRDQPEQQREQPEPAAAARFGRRSAGPLARVGRTASDRSIFSEASSSRRLLAMGTLEDGEFSEADSAIRERPGTIRESSVVAD